MEIKPTITSAALESEGGYRFIPAPDSAGTFQNVMNVVKGVGRMVGFSGAGGDSPIGSDFQDLITLQLEAQREMMLVSMISNVEKSKHETQMSPVRNIRVG